MISEISPLRQTIPKMNSAEKTALELLAPARDKEVARLAILHGADAVYMGGPSHGARASAANSIADIRQVAELAHTYGARLYVTLNTIIYDDELKAVEREVWDLWHAGVDALIVQDMALLRMSIPPIELHASTQCDIRSPEKARFLADCGFAQLVIPREFSLSEIKAVRQAIPSDVKIEAFVHGALCVSFSGDCQASCAANGRSANRGACAQMCRMAYDLVDAEGNTLIADKYLLSLRDLCRLDDLEDLAGAGVSSFKIEGRLKDAAYVKTVVTAYRRAIDKVIAANPDKYCRSSFGISSTGIDADVRHAFNRGFTSYFLNGAPAMLLSNGGKSPKWIGLPVGVVKRMAGKAIVADLKVKLENGDGLGFFDKQDHFCGFRLNRAEGDKLYPATPVEIAPGTALYRNSDAKREAALASDKPLRLIDIDLALELLPWGLSLSVDDGLHRCTASIDCAPDTAKSDQTEARRKALAKLGGTPFRLRSLADNVPPDAFIPASVLTSLRRKAVELMLSTILLKETRAGRRAHGTPTIKAPKALTYHDNVANRLARQFYLDNGAESIEPAFEISKPKGECTVMTTRYCLRRELGACLRQKSAKTLPSPLFLRNKAATYRLDFDCKNCMMRVVSC